MVGQITVQPAKLKMFQTYLVRNRLNISTNTEIEINPIIVHLVFTYIQKSNAIPFCVKYLQLECMQLICRVLA